MTPRVQGTSNNLQWQTLLADYIVSPVGAINHAVVIPACVYSPITVEENLMIVCMFSLQSFHLDGQCLQDFWGHLN